jgi:hypothetical protein
MQRSHLLAAADAILPSSLPLWRPPFFSGGHPAVAFHAVIPNPAAPLADGVRDLLSLVSLCVLCVSAVGFLFGL